MGSTQAPPPPPPPRLLTSEQMQDSEALEETLIFLDIDGVLNVGIRDPDGPVSFNEANLSLARKLLKGSVKSNLAVKLLSVMRLQHSSKDAGSTFGDFLSRNDLDVCDIFIHRFVKMMRAAGDNRRVILSSSWRKRHLSNVGKLENIIGGYLGETFKFDDVTAQEVEEGVHDRLRLIGDHIETYCSQHRNTTKFKVLVLDDFFYLPMRNFVCGGIRVQSLESAESYLEARTPPTIAVKVRIIHTYGNYILPCGMEVHIGTGISQEHLGDALAFLGPSPSFVGEAPEAAAGILSVQHSSDELKRVPSIEIQDNVETLIFLDIDGVLNVGVRDPINESTSFTEANVSVARKLFKGEAKNDGAEILLSVMHMQSCDGNSTKFGDFLSRNDLDVCDIFIHRLVEILRAVGRATRRVILSSSWRRPSSSAKVQQLENIISGYLSESFSFDDRTALVDEEGGHDRLRLIADYLAGHCSKEVGKARVKVLVLDDFFYLPIQDFKCGDIIVDSSQAAEAYLEACATPSAALNVRIVHTYKRDMSPSGLELQIGTGLSLFHLGQALEFLGAKFSQAD